MELSQLPKSFRAAVLFESPGALKVIDINMPVPTYGQVLVKIKVAGICRSQLMEMKGLRGEDRFLPHMMGHEAVAEVMSVGEGVSKVSVGQKVIVGWIKGEGIDAGGTQYSSVDGQVINAGSVTTFSEYALISENRVVLCPNYINDELAVLLGCALPTGAGMVLNQVKPKENSTILVVGLGGIGLSSLIMLNHFSPAKVVVIDTDARKRKLALKFGAHYAYSSNGEGLRSLLAEHSDGFDYAIESAGKCSTIELAFELIKNSGICYFASHPAHGEKIKLDPHQLICGKQIFGTWGGGCKPDSDINLIAKKLEQLDLPYSELTSDQFELKDINLAMNKLDSEEVTRVLIKM